MIAKFTAWLLEVIVKGIKSLLDMIYDAGVAILDGILTALASIISAIPAPGFLSQYSLSSLFGQLPSDVLYFIVKLDIGQGFLILGAGFAFYLARKIFTLGQW